MKIVSYIRISKEGTKQTGGKGLGLDAQAAIIRHYYPDVDKEFVEIKSAKTANRVELQRAIEYCNEYHFTLVVAKVDRLSRCVDDTLAIYKQLGKRLICCDIPGTLDKFMLTMYAAFAERERELISIRTKQALQAKIKRDGQYNFGNPHLNYKFGIEAIKRKAAENENNIRAMNYSKSLRDNELTLQSIADKLNAEGFKTSQNKAFSVSQVARLLRK